MITENILQKTNDIKFRNGIKKTKQSKLVMNY